MDWLAAVAAFTVMSTVVVVMFAFWGASVAGNANMRGRLEGLLSGTSVVDVSTPGALRQMPTGKSIIRNLIGENLRDTLALQLERADMTIQPSEWVIIRLAMALVGLAAPIVVIGGTFGLIAALVLAVVGYNLPKFYLKRRRKQRVAKLNSQLPEALTIISNALKAGFGLLQALHNAADQLDHPISTELGRTIHEMNIGSSAEESLIALSERSGSYDLDIVITAILVQRSVGGNLGEILDTVAETMRERIRIRGEIQTLTSQQKLTGVVIGFLPIGIGVLFQIMSPGYINPLFTTTMGKVMIGTACVLEVIGVMVIQRILDIEV
ncbi:MAG TPA: type II secretion system F family protein [Dehalococcoidia bacterium]|nr:type II secretion system F family protein [Dehalococcoidia bacterium]